MINGMLDFGDDDGISGFVGGGVGMARVKANNQRVFANTAPFLDDSDSKLAWQVFAGVRQAISDNIDVTVKYRFFNVDNLRMVAFNGNEAEWRFRSHSLLGGITFRFGGTGPLVVCQSNGEPITAANPCNETVCEEGFTLNPVTGQCERPTILCPPDPNPHPLGFVCPIVDPCPPEIRNQAGQCGPYTLFFGWNKDQLGDVGNGDTDSDKDQIERTLASQLPVLRSALDFYRKNGRVELLVVGHADRSGTDYYNEGLSCRRARTIRNWFIGEGVDPTAISTDWKGEADPQRPTADGVREVENRRVVITFGAGQGGRELACRD
jgi:hypothetical protein